jgi:N-dimethylarginine dimethylaminohydrolase
MVEVYQAAAYGGPGWSPRTTSLRQEIGSLWAACGQASEWTPLRAVLLHRPGAELATGADPDSLQMLDSLDAMRAGQQHDALAEAYRQAGVVVHYVEPDGVPPPNLIFCADLLFLTPEGAILGRPASTVRAGEERFIARRLTALGIPILRSIRGQGTFEGADAAWLDPQTVLLATGPRTNAEGAAQVTALLEEMGVEVLPVGLPYGAMHLMGQLRLVDRDLAIAWPGRVPYAAVQALRARGVTVLFAPDEAEAQKGMALNFVPLGPRLVLTPAGNPHSQRFYEGAGITCRTVQVDELVKAAGGIGCLTGILERAPA